MAFAKHAFGRFAGHHQPAGIIEKQHGFLQLLQQLLHVAAQFQSVLPGAAIQAEFGVNGGEFAGFAQRENGRIELAGANHIDAAPHALQRVEHHAGQHRTEENCDEQRCAKRQR